MHTNLKKSIAILQPYFFPYIPYFQLMSSVDEILIYDDVLLSSQNYSYSNFLSDRKGSLIRFGLNLNKKSPYLKYNEAIYLDADTKFFRKIHHIYSNAKNFELVYSMIKSLTTGQNRVLSIVNTSIINKIFKYLNINKKIKFTSQINYDRSATATNKILEICRLTHATYYINPIGGKSLYSFEQFANNSIELEFFESSPISYERYGIKKQYNNSSIIDILMHEDLYRIRDIIQNKQISS